VSARDAQELEQRFGRKPRYIPNGVSLEHSPNLEGAQSLLDAHGLVPGEFLIFVAGRIEPTKGAHLAIEAVKHLPMAVPLLIVGDKTQVTGYGRVLEEMAGSRVLFQPLVEDPAVLFGLIKASICLVFPSLVEAMSMVLLEAASLGVPIVCSDIIENRTVMQGDALYFESENVAALTDQLEWVLTHRSDATRLGERARQRVQTQHSWDSIAVSYAELYREVHKERNG
jgi:glycosyltransferase involved in cell wall biosynthesis